MTMTIVGNFLYNPMISKISQTINYIGMSAIQNCTKMNFEMFIYLYEYRNVCQIFIEYYSSIEQTLISEISINPI